MGRYAKNEKLLIFLDFQNIRVYIFQRRGKGRAFRTKRQGQAIFVNIKKGTG